MTIDAITRLLAVGCIALGTLAQASNRQLTRCVGAALATTGALALIITV